MKSMNKNVRKAIVVLLALLVSTLVVYAVTIWTWRTEVKIEEPFVVESDLPKTLSLYPGEKAEYTIKVTNEGKVTYEATLYYEVEASQGVKFTIEPKSGTSQEVRPGDSVTFRISIIIHRDSAAGILTIDWRIERG